MRGIEALNGIVWGPAGLGLLFGTGLLLTVRTGGFQLRRWGYWMRHTLGAILTDRSVTAHTAREEQAISQFQSLCTALASTIGTGNLVGVATAILSGGAGAVFWMWVMALLGMMTSYAENVLGIYYRRKDPAGGWRGGPMYYLRDGLGGKPGRVLAVLFAAFCALASFGIGNLSQLNSIAGNLKAAFGVPEAVTGAVLAAVSAVILLGGLKRVAAVAERLVPAMALLYIVGALTVVGVHITAVPAALAAIVKGAFGLRAAGGGMVGYGLSRAVTWGFKRGAFSNEAGLGSSVMVHAASNVKEPVQQGMWGIFEVFADTMVVCTLTALVVLTSGFVEPDTGRIAAGAAGSALVGQAFDAVFGALGSKLIAVCILLFAYSTTLGWSCYGCKAVEYLFGAGAGAFYRVLFVALMPLGVVVSQYLGAGDHKETREAVHTSLAIAVVMGLLLTVGGVACGRALLVAMNTPAEVLADAVTYIRIYFGGVLFSVVYNMTAGILNAAGNSRRSLVYLAWASVTNIVLDFVFIVGLRMGVAGAAIATDLSQLVSCVLSLRFLMKSEDACRVELSAIRLHRKMAGRIIRVGLPTGIQNMVISFSNVLVQASVNSYGAAAMAGFAAYMKIDGFNILPVSSISMAATTFVGQNYGAGRLDRVKRSVWVTLAIGVIYTLCTGAALLAGQDAILHLFTADEAVVTYGKLAMRWFCPFYFLLSILHGLAGAVRGTGASIPPMVVLLVSLCLFRVVWIQFLLPFFSGIEGVFILYPVSWGLGALLMILYAWKGKWMEYHT